MAGMALANLEPDVVVLTEYVADKSHGDFLGVLKAAGLAQIEPSGYVAGQNQVLIASRSEWEVDDSNPPDHSSATTPNWRHLRLATPGFDLIGLRVPMFRSAAVRSAYWDWLENAVLAMRDRPTVLIGDLNADPGRAHRVGGGHLTRLADQGWCLATPDAGWSFVGKTGRTSRIDHAILSPHFRLDSKPQYVPEWNGFKFAGPEAYSDHAVLCVDISKTG